MITTLRALLALILLAGLYLLALIMTLVWLVFAVGAVWVLARGNWFNTSLVTMSAGACVALALTVREVARISQPVGVRPDSVRVTRKQSPQLWQTVQSLAEEIGTARPSEIRLISEANAAVTDDGWLLGLRAGHRRIYIGVPLLVGLRPAQLRAVLAHELGHFARRHGRFSGPARRSSIALAEARQRIREAMVANDLVRYYSWPLHWIVVGYAAMFDRLTLPIRRRLEIEADREAARVAGPAAAIAALRSVPALATAWAQFLREHVEPVRKATGCVPDDPFQAFACMVDDPEGPAVLAELRRHAPQVPSSPRDTHPSLAVRLALLEDRPAGTRDEPDLGAAELSAGCEELFRRVGATLPGHWTARKRPWRDWLGTLARRQTTLALQPLAGAVRKVGAAKGVGGATDVGRVAPATLALTPVLDLLASGRASDLARVLDPDRPHTQEADGSAREQLVAAVGTLVGQALVAQGVAQWAVGWTGRSRLIAAGTEPGQVDDWVRTAVDDPDQVPRLRTNLAALHVDESTPVTCDPDGDTVAPAAAPRLRAGRTITIAPGLDDATRQHHHTIRNAVLAVMVGLLLLSGVVWLGRPDDWQPPPQPLIPSSNPGLDHRNLWPSYPASYQLYSWPAGAGAPLGKPYPRLTLPPYPWLSARPDPLPGDLSPRRPVPLPTLPRPTPR